MDTGTKLMDDEEEIAAILVSTQPLGGCRLLHPVVPCNGTPARQLRPRVPRRHSRPRPPFTPPHSHQRRQVGTRLGEVLSHAHSGGVT